MPNSREKPADRVSDQTSHRLPRNKKKKKKTSTESFIASIHHPVLQSTNAHAEHPTRSCDQVPANRVRYQASIGGSAIATAIKAAAPTRRKSGVLTYLGTWVPRLRVKASHCSPVARVSWLRVIAAHAVSTIAGVSRLRVFGSHAAVSTIPWVAGLDFWRAPTKDAVGG